MADRVATEPLVVRFVGDLVGEVQGGMLDSILPDVLDRLAADPDQVRAIVRGQSRGMVDEATHVARSRSVAGDEIVDRLAARILRRQPSRRVIPGIGGRHRESEMRLDRRRLLPRRIDDNR